MDARAGDASFPKLFASFDMPYTIVMQNDTTLHASSRRTLAKMLQLMLEAYLALDWKELAGVSDLKELSLKGQKSPSYRLILSLRACAELRGSGNIDSPEAAWLKATSPRVPASGGCDEPLAIFTIESAAWLMGLGSFSAALSRLDILGGLPVGTYPLFRFHTVRALCLSNLGRAKEAATAILALARAARHPLIPQGRLLLARCRLGLATLRGQEKTARSIVEEYPLFRRPENAREHLLQLEQARHFLALGEVFRAEQLLAHASEFSDRFISDLHGEMLLRGKVNENVIKRLEDLVRGDIMEGSQIGACDAHFLLARAYEAVGNGTLVLQHLESAARIARELDSQSRLARILAFHGFLEAKAERKELACQFFEEAQQIAMQHGLRTLAHLCGISLMAFTGIEKRSMQFEEFFPRSPDAYLRTEYAQFRGYLCIDEARVFSVKRIGTRSSNAVGVGFLGLCDRFLAHGLWACLWEGGRVLLRSDGTRMRLIHLSNSPLLYRAVELMFRFAGDSMALEDLHHALWVSSSYSPERHRQRCKAILARTRAILADIVEVTFDARTSRYLVTSRIPTYRVARPRRRVHESSETPDVKLMRVLHETRILTPSQACALLGLSRQALHKYVVLLREEGKIRIQGKGRATVYLVAT